MQLSRDTHLGVQLSADFTSILMYSEHTAWSFADVRGLPDGRYSAFYAAAAWHLEACASLCKRSRETFQLDPSSAIGEYFCEEVSLLYV